MDRNQQDWRTQLREMAMKLRQEEEIEQGGLIDRILETLLQPSTPEIKTLVGHQWPDDDVWLSLWLAQRFLPEAKDAEIAFVNAGESLPGSESDHSVVHFDTGGGAYDQHGKGFKKTASAEILARALGVRKDPGLQELLEMVIKVDNVEPIPATSIHFTIEGYPHLSNLRLPNGQPDWKTIQERVFELFNTVYGQETQKAKSRANLERFAERTVLSNGLTLGILLWHPELREAAFERGAAVVVWTEGYWVNKQTGVTLSLVEYNQEKRRATQEGSFNPDDWKRVFYTGIQTNRRFPSLYLSTVAFELRTSEAEKLGISVSRAEQEQLYAVGREGPITRWFLHDSLHLILNGSRTWTPRKEELTELTPSEIVGIVTKTLSRIPRNVFNRNINPPAA